SAPKNLNKLSTTFTLVETDGLGGLNDTGVTQCADDTKYVDCALPTTQAAFPAQDAHLQTPFNFDTTVAPGCVLDRTTGLLWELKLADQNNLTPYRNMSKIYNWYEPAGLINGDVPGIAGSGNNKGCALGVAGDTACTTYEYIKRVNADKLCGHATWRLPKLDELVSLVDYSFSKSTPYSSTNCIAKRPLISSVFMNTAPGEYWTATSAAVDPRLAWVVNFGQNVCQDTQLDGATRHVVKGADDTYARYVRLVAKYQPQP
ncbi:MAG: DUF1566 domain-containing protein, partial [Gammaproteobacteria bacterium]|nr:DUF1566 domain-containing protein [Gammaproteobacteria bacterium]